VYYVLELNRWAPELETIYGRRLSPVRYVKLLNYSTTWTNRPPAAASLSEVSELELSWTTECIRSAA
jgi:hypothetical protein